MQIKFLTVNAFHGGTFLDNLIDFLRNEKADIIAMQEVYNGTNSHLDRNFRTVDEIQKELSMYKYVSFAPSFLDDRSVGKIERGNTIFSRWSIVTEDSIFYDFPYGVYQHETSTRFENFPYNLQHAVIQAEHVQLNVFNTHGVWGFDGEDNERRLHMSEVIVNSIKGKENVLLAGDFNVQPHTKTIQQIEHHLTNVFKDELKTSFNMSHKKDPAYAKAVVDMMFVSKNIQVVEHSIPSVDVSDHLPLVGVFNILS